MRETDFLFLEFRSFPVPQDLRKYSFVSWKFRYLVCEKSLMCGFLKLKLYISTLSFLYPSLLLKIIVHTFLCYHTSSWAGPSGTITENRQEPSKPFWSIKRTMRDTNQSHFRPRSNRSGPSGTLMRDRQGPLGSLLKIGETLRSSFEMLTVPCWTLTELS